MREILFRGKRTDDGEWIEGYYCPCCFGRFPCRPAIVPKDRMDDGSWEPKEIIPETVGQYIGLTDKNGTKIFEGDVVRTKYGRPCIVIWFASKREVGWDLQVVPTQEGLKYKAPSVNDLYLPENLEVVGNIHDNTNREAEAYT